MEQLSTNLKKLLAYSNIIHNFALPILGYNYKHQLLSTMATYLEKEKKQEIFEQYGKSNADTGSAESQVALFSYRITHLTNHLKSNKKDFATQRSLLKLVGKRRRRLDYLKETDIERYRNILKALNLRK